MSFKTLLIRTLSGIVYVALIFCAILFNEYLFAIIFGILCALTTYEFHKLTNKQENVNALAWLGAAGSLLLFALVFFQSWSDDISCNENQITEQLVDTLRFVFLYLYILFFIFVFVVEIIRNQSNPIHNIAYVFLSQIYIVLPFLFMTGIIFKFHKIIFLALFVLIWANDVFAYLIGSLAGRHKLIVRISPNKSWEGLFGGLVGALIAGFVFSKINMDLNLIQWLGFALVIVIFGTLGDLFESLIKRTIGVKDSGNIMPGHGGFLDRLDSVLFAAPAAMIYLIIIA